MDLTERPPNTVAWMSTPHRVTGLSSLTTGLTHMYGDDLRLVHAPGGYWVIRPPEEPQARFVRVDSEEELTGDEEDGGPLSAAADLPTPRRDDDPVHEEPAPPFRGNPNVREG